MDDSDSDASLPQISSIRRSSRTTPNTKKTQPPLSSPLSELRSSQVEPPSSGAFFNKPRQPRRKAESVRKTRSQRIDPSDAEDDEPIMPATARRKASDNFVDLGSDNETDEDSDVARPPARKRLRTASSPIKAPAMSSDDDDDDIPRSSRKRTRAPAAEVVELSSGSESEPDTSPKKRRHVVTTEEQQEIEDDLKDLESSSSEIADELSKPASKTPVKSQRQLALERLKRRRAGLNDDDDDDVDNEPTQRSSTGKDASSSDDDDLPEAPPGSSARDMFKADEYDEGFLTDEGDDTLGAPDGIPLAFTRYASMKPKELFKFAVEWMLQKKLNPGFNGNDEIYKLTFSKLDDEVKGLAGSKFESSAWKAEFLFALRARPQIAIGKMSRSDPGLQWKDKCDACNRSGHTPTYEIQFQGQPYNATTLEDVEGNDSDSEDEEDSGQRDALGHVILPEAHSFYVGKFCMANADTAHSLQHWRYHLYEWVAEWLDSSGHNSAENLVKRNKWGEPKRRKFANKVLDEMAESGKIKELYRDYKSSIEKARDAKQYSRNGGDSP
ncbi:hypothetical protein K461DRAFT_302940 [Myriangium duriaei CBS 260.36]|uniref:DUF4211 domain-containing protein n=1 Tax=Myriangium duriaei CBS 260.36 TaxID=1168546 RepID=A0A9P4IVY8_9PEZI|nr:hypothetical protein K461DRAFT_302940 [Myriangium duriaei CBS 260.36]